MKKYLFGVIFALIGLVFGADACQTLNPIEGLYAVGSIVSSVAYVTNFQGIPNALYLVSLTNLPRSVAQKTNAGGNRKFLVAACEDFTSEWPLEANVGIDGTCNVIPPLKAGKAFAEIDFTDNTAKADYSKEGDEGHQCYKHMAECKVSGYAGPQWKVLRGFLNMRFVLIAKHGDRQLVVYGTSEDGLSMKETHSTGLKGNDKREFTLKMEQDGLDFAPVILASTVSIPTLL